MILCVMRYFSTRGKSEAVSFKIAALAGLAPDGGLYVPEEIPQYSTSVKSSLGSMSYNDIALETISPWVAPDISKSVLQDLINSAYPFSPELVSVDDRLVLELFHGPTAAFKDYGARFMARAFSYLRRGEDRPLTILVATSGDTGGAVADGFYGVKGISVTILYPKGRVSPLQEKQIAGLGGNITALAVEGSFDDCQLLVKQAFADEDLSKRLVLSSANSINISRLIPQITYYAYAAGRALNTVISVPSGNFGNLTAGLYAVKMGAPIGQFVAATNVNKTVPDYLESGIYKARPSIATLSNAMDVGAPSNFERIKTHFSLEEMRRLILGAAVSDTETKETISYIYSRCGYCLDPHSAVSWRALDMCSLQGSLLQKNAPAIVVSTAHPAKFTETVEAITGPVAVPPALLHILERNVENINILAKLEALKESLLD